MVCLKSTPVVITASVYAMIFASCFVAVRFGSSPRSVVENAAVLFVILACSVSAMTVLAHLRNYTHPGMQKYTVRMLLMVPIYSVESFLALRANEEWVIIWETLRETYEVPNSHHPFVIHD